MKSFCCIKKKNKVYPKKYIVNEETNIIKTIIESCYNNLNNNEIMQYTELLEINNKTYYVTYSIYNKIIGMHIEELKFINKYYELHIPINNLYATNIISQFECVECGLYHANCTYSNCNHFVNHECAIETANTTNICKECNNSLVFNKVYLVESEEIDTCSICLEDTNIMLLECRHHFHEKCIRQHCETSNSCPMCREDITKLKITNKKYNNIRYSLGSNNEGIFDLNFTSYF